MEFAASLTVVYVRSGTSDKSRALGTWQAGFDNNLTLFNSKDMQNFTADVVYKVVTVEVSHLKIALFWGFICRSFQQKPFIYKDPTAKKGFRGYCIDLIDKIAEILKFDYEIEAVADGMFGNMDEQGNWNGIIKVLFATMYFRFLLKMSF